MKPQRTRLLVTLLITVSLSSGCAPSRTSRSKPDTSFATVPREIAFEKRPLRLVSGDRWIGNGIAYGPYRDDQFPGGPIPSREELSEDLDIMGQYWNLIRLYSAGEPSETILDIIRRNELDMKVVLGVWIAPEARHDDKGEVVAPLPEVEAANRREVADAIRLATDYPDVVVAISVGNETQVFWSAHRSSPDVLVRYIRDVRARTRVPVTTADDYNFWNKPQSRRVAQEIDFIMMHAHPLWNGQLLEGALRWTQQTFDSISAAHPDHVIVLAETGWATKKHNVGEQARLIKGQPGEQQQKIFHEQFSEWVASERIASFFFVAFDENWKGGDHPDEVEKHWGLYRANREPKAAVAPRD